MKNAEKVYLADAHVGSLEREQTLPHRFKRMLNRFPLGRTLEGKVVAVKIHEGTGVGFTTVRPIFIRGVIEKIKGVGGEPFVTGGIGWPVHSKVRGYTEEVLGAPLFPGAGVTDQYLVSRDTGDEDLPAVEVCGNIAHAEAMVVVSHAKGHGHCGFGGTLKNLGMGCVSRRSRDEIHRLMDTGFSWKGDQCMRCKQCVQNCPTGAVRFKANDTLDIFLHDCRYCMHCVTSCPTGAIAIDMRTYRIFQKGLALASRAVLEGFSRGRLLFINVIMDVTPLCDCWGFSSQAIVPDVGIMASRDPVAVDQATLDVIDHNRLIPGTLPKPLALEGKNKGHLFDRIHRKNPYFQVKAAAALGLGVREYRIIPVE